MGVYEYHTANEPEQEEQESDLAVPQWINNFHSDSLHRNLHIQILLMINMNNFQQFWGSFIKLDKFSVWI